MTDDWKVFVIHWIDGDPIAVCAPDFERAVTAALEHVNEDSNGEDWIDRELFLGWIYRIEIASYEPIVVWIDPADVPPKRTATLEAHVMAIGRCLAAHDFDGAWAEYGRAANEIQGMDAQLPALTQAVPASAKELWISADESAKRESATREAGLREYQSRLALQEEGYARERDAFNARIAELEQELAKWKGYHAMQLAKLHGS